MMLDGVSYAVAVTIQHHASEPYLLCSGLACLPAAAVLIVLMTKAAPHPRSSFPSRLLWSQPGVNPVSGPTPLLMTLTLPPPQGPDPGQRQQVLGAGSVVARHDPGGVCRLCIRESSAFASLPTTHAWQRWCQ